MWKKKGEWEEGMIEEEGFSYMLANHEIGGYLGARHWKLKCITSTNLCAD